MRPRNLFLIGFRGAGKTTVGRLLAHRTGGLFRDMDAEIERCEGRTIAAIVSESGWAEFRRLEAALLAEICRGDGQVVSTGGGIVLDPENVARMRASGWVLWLEVSAEAARRRIAGDTAGAAGRPALGPGGGTLAEIPGLIAERAGLYRSAAHASIATDGRAPEEICRRVADEIRRRLGGIA